MVPCGRVGKSGLCVGGPVERVGLPVFAALQGYAGLAVGGMLPPEVAEHGLDDVIVSILRGCAP